MCSPHASLPTLLLFDIGGVVVSSPLHAIHAYEARLALPRDYLNVSIRYRGAQGAFQRLERGEMGVWEFYEAFGRELADVGRGNAWYKEWCKSVGREVPPSLPGEDLHIDGRELFGLMMRQSAEPNTIMVDAIKKLKASGKFRLAALTNNFAPPTALPSSSSPSGSAPASDLSAELAHLGVSPSSPSHTSLRALFDPGAYYESSLIGARKPEPAAYAHVLAAQGLRPDQAREVLFLDDIGPNLKAARKLGFNTIKVGLESCLGAVQDLERWTRMELVEEGARAREKERLRELARQRGGGGDVEGRGRGRL